MNLSIMAGNMLVMAWKGMFIIFSRVLYQSLSTRMVPARVESAPTAPEMFTNTTNETKVGKSLSFMAGLAINAITVPPATMNERFCDTSQS